MQNPIVVLQKFFGKKKANVAMVTELFLLAFLFCLSNESRKRIFIPVIYIVLCKGDPSPTKYFSNSFLY